MGTFEQAQALHKAGKKEEAARLYEQLVSADPGDLNALHFLGLLRHEQGRHADAIELFQRVSSKMPSFPESWAAMALCFRALGRSRESMEAVARTLELNPRHPVALNLQGFYLHQQGDYARAARCFGQALQADPRHAEAAHNLGITLHFLGRPGDAVGCYRRALVLKPDSAQIHYNLGLALEAASDLPGAIQSFQRALELQPSHLEAFYRLGYLKRMVCDWDGLADYVERLEARLADYEQDAGGLKLSPLVALVLNLSPDTQRKLARGYARLTEATVRDLARPERVPAAGAGERIRIGYLSPDFGQHAIGMLVRDLFAGHDRQRFEVCTYSLRSEDHPNLDRVRETSDVFRDLSALSFEAAAAAIAADGVQILVDLAGYTRDSRPEILALRPAPVQVSWLGYLDTMGASFIDYLIADDIAVPQGEDARFDEAIVRLPHSFLIGSPVEPADDVPSRESLGLPAEGVVYASFNNSYKLDPELFHTWMQILHAVEGSVLWLYPGKSIDTGPRLRDLARRAGIDPARIVLTGGVGLEQHLARQRHADLFLDAFQYGAGATGVAALMAGLPVLTLRGRRMIARMGASMNVAVGLEDLVCEDVQAYRDTAVRIGTDPACRRELQERVARARTSSALFDPTGFAKRLENAYEQMWARREAGKEPGPITVTD